MPAARSAAMTMLCTMPASTPLGTCNNGRVARQCRAIQRSDAINNQSRKPKATKDDDLGAGTCDLGEMRVLFGEMRVVV